MPRKGKGGKVEGSTQTAYANRTDLNNRGPQPITAAPGEPYGQRQMLEDAQRAVPMSGTPQPATPVAQAPSVDPNVPKPIPHGGAGGLGLWDVVPHPPLPEGVAGPRIVPNSQSAAQRISDALSLAAASPYATKGIQELAGFAKSLGS